MLLNYLKIAIRNLQKQKIYSLITIFGLAVGLGVFLFFFRFFWWGFTADEFHEDADRTYAVVQVFDAGSEDDRHTMEVNYPLMSLLEDGIPEIEEITRMYWPGTMILSEGDKLFYERGILFTDPNFLSFFTFKPILGNPAEMLSGTNSIVITQPLALKYFGDENPIGKLLTLNNQVDVTVTGVLETTDKSESLSTLNFDFLISMDVAIRLYGPNHYWNSDNQTGFVRLVQDTDPLLVGQKMDAILHKFYPDKPESPKKIYLYPLTEIAYDTFHIDNYYGSSASIGKYIFLIIGLLFLLIVCFNYVNLSTARYSERLQEVGLRKVVGAKRSQLVFQFLGESIVLTTLAFPLAAAFYGIASNLFTTHAGIAGIAFQLDLWTHSVTMIFFIGITLLTGVLGGIYPAFFLSSFQPSTMLKNQTNKSGGKNRLRWILVVAQFSISAIFIVMSIVWMKQADFINTLDLGYDRHDVMVVQITDDAKDKIQILKDAFKQVPAVTEISASTSIPGNWKSRGEIFEEGKTEADRWSTYVYSVDEKFLDVLDIQILSGENFSKEQQDASHYIISHQLVEYLSLENPVGKMLTVNGQSGVIIGISENCYFTNLFFPQEPIVFKIEKDNFNYLLLEFSDNTNMVSHIQKLEDQWRAIFADIPFEWFTLDDYFKGRDLNGINLMSAVFGFIGGIAIFFSCLGLLGLTAYATRQRTKEIGIRKVFGASISNILTILGSSFLNLVFISNIVAIPLAYFGTNSLLQFAYKKHVTIGVDVFVITILLLFLTALIAVTTQSLKAALANPINSIRYE
ncbi:ABC transporter permease [Calditrichota bacterium]